MMTKIEQIKELTERLLQYCHEYYDLDHPTISDQEYDKQYDELKKLEDETNFWLSNSPTRKVQGQVLDCFTKVTHSKPMLSAAKTKDINEIKKFVDGSKYYCSYKLDGITLCVRYEHGRLKQAITRGTGTIGEDVTEQAKMISNLPLSIPYEGNLELRGECVISLENFKRINKELWSIYSHPRNLAAGSIRQLDTNVVKNRCLSYVVFECVSELYNGNFQSDSKLDELAFIENLGFETVQRMRGCGAEICIEYMKPDNYKYPVDGLIFEYTSRIYSKSLPATSHHEGCRIAYKFSDDTYETTLRDVVWQTSRSGKINPVAVFDEVDLGGALTTRATLHNVSIIEGLELGIGDTITVCRSNMVIPYITDNLTRSNTLQIPDVCPTCGHKAEIYNEHGSKTLYCSNPHCEAKTLYSLIHFCSRNAMNIEGMSEATLDWLINHCEWVNSFKSLYYLSEWRDAWIRHTGYGAKSVDKLLMSIENSRKVKLENFIVALSIPGIGTSAAKTISEHFNSDFDAFFDALTGDFDWVGLPDFGEITARNIADYGAQNAEMVRSLAEEMEFIVEEKKEVQNDFINGKVFVVTGAFNTLKRSEIERLIVDRGGKLAGSVSSKTHCLLTNDAGSGSSKAKKAAELNIPIMSEQEFLSKL